MFDEVCVTCDDLRIDDAVFGGLRWRSGLGFMIRNVFVGYDYKTILIPIYYS
jgi:hypothetical protein